MTTESYFDFGCSFIQLGGSVAPTATTLFQASVESWIPPAAAPAAATSPALSTGAIAGIAVAGVVVLLVLSVVAAKHAAAAASAKVAVVSSQAGVSV